MSASCSRACSDKCGRLTTNLSVVFETMHPWFHAVVDKHRLLISSQQLLIVQAEMTTVGGRFYSLQLGVLRKEPPSARLEMMYLWRESGWMICVCAALFISPVVAVCQCCLQINNKYLLNLLMFARCLTEGRNNFTPLVKHPSCVRVLINSPPKIWCIPRGETTVPQDWFKGWFSTLVNHRNSFCCWLKLVCVKRAVVWTTVSLIIAVVKNKHPYGDTLCF